MCNICVRYTHLYWFVYLLALYEWIVSLSLTPTHTPSTKTGDILASCMVSYVSTSQLTVHFANTSTGWSAVAKIKQGAGPAEQKGIHQRDELQVLSVSVTVKNQFKHDSRPQR
jgi:hypothetical protein